MQTSKEARTRTGETLVTQDVTIIFGRAPRHPQWSLVLDSYTAGVDFLNAAPVFTNVGPTAYDIRITLEGATFVPADTGNQPLYDLWDHAQGDLEVDSQQTPNYPLTVGDLDSEGRTVTVGWSNEPTIGDWRRWIYRFWVRPDGSGDPVPFPLAFVSLLPDPFTDLLTQPVSGQPVLPSSPNDPSSPASHEGATLTTSIVNAGGLPQYPNVFDADRVNLPDNTYLDPLIDVVERDRPFRLEFTSGSGHFFPTTPTPCNPGRVDEAPLSLLFLGVTDPDPECGGQAPVPVGFVTSGVSDQPHRACQVDWYEPARSPEQQVASFVFADQDGQQLLLDPTIINDLLQPPPGTMATRSG